MNKEDIKSMAEALKLVNELSKTTLSSYAKKAPTDGEKNRTFGKRLVAIAINHPDRKEGERFDKEADDKYRKVVNRRDGTALAHKKLAKEEVEPLDELSKKTLANYIGAASYDKSMHAHDIGKINQKAADGGTTDRDRKERDYFNKQHGKRSGGIGRAANKLAKEDMEVFDFSANGALNRYFAKLKETVKHGENKYTIHNHKTHNVAASFGVSDDSRDFAVKTAGVGTFYVKNANKNVVAAYKHDGKKATQIDRQPYMKHSDSMKEEVEDLEELSQKKIDAYRQKAFTDQPSTASDDPKRHKKRSKGRTLAFAKATGIGAKVKATESVSEGYKEVEDRWVSTAATVADEIYNLVTTLVTDHDDAQKAGERIEQAYKNGGAPSEADRKICDKKFYDAKYVVRQLEDIRDSLEGKTKTEKVVSDEAVATPKRYYESVNPETRTPVSIRDALGMMETRDRHTDGATPPEPIDDKFSGMDKKFIALHKVHEPDESNIDAAINKNNIEVGASLQRSVNYRHNDHRIGDK